MLVSVGALRRIQHTLQELLSSWSQQDVRPNEWTWREKWQRVGPSPVIYVAYTVHLLPVSPVYVYHIKLLYNAFVVACPTLFLQHFMYSVKNSHGTASSVILHSIWWQYGFQESAGIKLTRWLTQVIRDWAYIVQYFSIDSFFKKNQF